MDMLSPIRPPQRRLCEPLEPRTLLSSGDLDSTFGANGATTANFPGSTFQVFSSAVDWSDGKIVLGGIKGTNAAVARLNSDGTPDTTFGNGGLVEILSSIPHAPSSALGVAVQADSSIVLVGSWYDTSQQYSIFSVARVTAAGQLDSSFGSSGTGVVSTAIGDDAGANAVAIQNDQKIVVAGSALTGSIYTGSQNEDFAVVRYNTDGSLDTSFASNGVRDAGFGADDFASAVAIDYNGNPTTNPYWGSIAVVGETKVDNSVPSSPSDFAVLKLLPNGNPDNSFDGDGKVITHFPQGDTFASGVVIQPGGKVVATGSQGWDYLPYNYGGLHDFALARYLPTGALDTGFGDEGTGRMLTGLSSTNDVANTAMASYVGGILVSGVSDGKFAIAAYNKDGFPDTRFPGGGFMTVDLGANGSGTSGITTMAAYPTRRFIITGGTSLVARYTDVGSVVAVGSFQPIATEQGPTSATFIVGRTQTLNTTERVYLDVSGTARHPGEFPFSRAPDYTGTNIHFGQDFTTDRTYVDIPAGQPYTVVTITPIDDTLVEGDETAVFSVSPNPLYDIGTPPSVTLVIRDNDVTSGPAVTSSQFIYDSSPQHVYFQFNQDVGGSIGANDFAVNGPSGAVPFSFSYDNIKDVATLSFSAILADGNYTATASASGITNASGTPMSSDYPTGFFFLSADGNHDGKVDVTDLGIFATNWQKTGVSFSQGDFNYDGKVDVTDLGILATNWQKSIPTSPAAAMDAVAALPWAIPGQVKRNDRTGRPASLASQLLESAPY